MSKLSCYRRTSLGTITKVDGSKGLVGPRTRTTLDQEVERESFIDDGIRELFRIINDSIDPNQRLRTSTS